MGGEKERKPGRAKEASRAKCWKRGSGGFVKSGGEGFCRYPVEVAGVRRWCFSGGGSAGVWPRQRREREREPEHSSQSYSGGGNWARQGGEGPAAEGQKR